jgi:hypothetical protein
VKNPYVLSALIVAVLAGCSSVDNPESVQAGNWNVTINVNRYDEFDRREVSTDETEVVLSAKDRTLHASIPRGGTSYTFTNLPYQSYVATIQGSGYYPAFTSFYSSVYGSLVGGASLFRFPSPMVRVDSIACIVNSAVPQIHFVLYTAQTLPVDGTRSAVMFAGLRPDVTSRYGDYVYALSSLNQVPGTSVIQTDDLFRRLRAAGIGSGVRVYVTARIGSGATFAGWDPATSLNYYGNLENNTRAVATFIMP